jgi:starch phosphorylase
LRWHRPAEEAQQHPDLLAVLEAIGSGAFSRGESRLFQPLLRSLWEQDDYMLFADFPSYLKAQERVGRTYADTELWTRKAILNVARMGFFSSDRAIREYCEQIWKVKRVRVTLPADLAERSLFQPPANS